MSSRLRTVTWSSSRAVDGRGWVRGEAEAFKGADVELALDQWDREVAGPDPVFHTGAGGNALESGGELGAGCEKDFARAGFDDFVDGLLEGGGAGEFGGAEFAGGDVEQGDGGDLIFG